MRGIKTAIGIMALGLLFAATPAAAEEWGSPQSASTGNLAQPSMILDANGAQHVVARGDTGLWYVTNKSGSWARTRLTQDYDTSVNGAQTHHVAVHPQVAINAAGTITVVYAVNVFTGSTPGSCASNALRYTVRSGGSWSSPKNIRESTCEIATGISVHGSKIYLATIAHPDPSAARVSYVTNASGSWTHATVASGLSNRLYQAALTTYDGKPMLAYVKSGNLVYARGATSVGSFIHETAATVDATATSQPSVAINEANDWPMIVWTQSDGTHYGYRNANGWYSKRVMRGTSRAMLAFDASGYANVVSADGLGGLWFGHRYNGTWYSYKLDDHTVTDLGGLGMANGYPQISYIRGTTHLYSIISFEYHGC
jgi:hypothetical protein